MFKRARVESEVCGGMATGLQVLRLFGLAPLRFSLVRNGVYSISHSCIIYILSTITILFINVILIYFYLYTLWYDNNDNTSIFYLVKLGRHTALVLPIITITSAAICNANRRMDNLMSILNQIQKIRGIIRCEYKSDPTPRQVLVTLSSFLLLSFSLHIFDLTLVDHSVNILYGTINYNIIIYFKIAIDIGHSIILVLQLQYLFLATILRLTIKPLNNRLRQLFVNNERFRITPRCSNIRNLSKSYLMICEVIIEVTETEGLYLIMILFCCLIRILVATYNFWFVYKEITSSNHFLQKQILQVYRLIIHSIYVLLVIEPFHRLNNEMENTRSVISTLMRRLPRRSFVQHELDVFQHLVLKQPTITPLGLFKLNRSLITTFSGYVVTFLLISNQFQHFHSV